jgi:hypothetical protein
VAVVLRVSYHPGNKRVRPSAALSRHAFIASAAHPAAGLGALSGAMLAGDAVFVAAARVWLRRFGGNT